MSFLSHLTEQVAAPTRKRGANYFLQRRVRNLEGDDYEISATVSGTSAYDVEAYRDDDALVVYCSCPFFESNHQTCKHIWAALLAADRKGMLEGDGTTDGLYIDVNHDNEFAAELGEYEENDVGTETSRFRVAGARTRKKTNRRRPPKPAAPQWQKQLSRLHKELADRLTNDLSRQRWQAGRRILYVIEVGEFMGDEHITLTVGHRERKQNGDWSKPKFESIASSVIAQLPDAEDRKILTILRGAGSQPGGYSYTSYDYAYRGRFALSSSLAEVVLPFMCRTGRCHLRLGADTELQPLAFDEGEPWSFAIKISKPEDTPCYRVTGHLRRGEETVDLSQALFFTPKFVFWPGRVSPFTVAGSFDWVRQFCTVPRLEFPKEQSTAWLQQFLRLPHLPSLELPAELNIQEVQGTPRPLLRIEANKERWAPHNVVAGKLSFDYAGQIADPTVPGPIFLAETNQLIRRDANAEANSLEFLMRMGFSQRVRGYGEPPTLELNIRHLPRVVPLLLAQGWHVEAEGKLYRQPGKIDIEVTTGIDWFELHGSVQFDDTHVALPALLSALKRGEKTVVLGDGSLGMLPEEWLKKHGLLAGLGTVEGGTLKFRRNQAGLLDAMLAAQPEARFDSAFAKIRQELRVFDGIKPADPPAEFQGVLRGYQREGLGWLHFLRRFGFGGCLADDMGLGKTVQVLALLDARRREGPKLRPTLVVVPKSLVFNWQQETARFTPDLRVLDHAGGNRLKPGDHFENYDIILTTYGILRRDALEFKDRKFDYCILDEAQAIKNAKSESAKAVRLIQADHRLTVTGTPIENHLGELWSLFEFLNPGMLGQASVFQLSGVGARNPEPETRQLLAKALRPFLLRRTKEQVAKDLPSKTEQTLYAEMEPAQHKLYDELRDHYRQSLLTKIAKDGIAKSKIQILEALLRLRQAACHPGLIDKSRVSEPSAKLDLLMPQLAQVLDEGHKALVFSQFTSMLAIVRQRLDQDNITYEYLDGRTRDRGAKVDRFQNDPACKLFLISLKAGGLGLNLTAAEYVFLLDPWWNPAVEAQAIDRTHRIGQTAPVFAYRLIVKDTVEEKVLELQNKKRTLADAILNADNSLIRNLGREELDMLLA